MYEENKVYFKIRLVDYFSRHEVLFFLLFSFISIDEVSSISCCFFTNWKLLVHGLYRGCTGVVHGLVIYGAERGIQLSVVPFLWRIFLYLHFF